MGVGIFNVQGFERQNKEIKFNVQHKCNNRQNICCQSMKQLQLSYENKVV